MVFLTDNTLAEILVVAGCILILSFLFAECFDWTKLFSLNDILYQYGYEDHNGPHTWKSKFPHSCGQQQSPINITSNYAICVPNETKSSLKFSSEYCTIPKYMVLTNDTHGVVVYGCWNQGVSPAISSGPLEGCYRFVNARFKWGPNDDEGSEHTINNARYGMEVQSIHVKPKYKCCPLATAAEANAVAIVSHLYKVTQTDNPYLESVISSLNCVKCPLSQVQIEPIPLSWIAPPFSSKYFVYTGSLTQPPCTEGVQWIIQSEPLNISAKQLSKFRKLLTLDGVMDNNTRPIQELNCRDVYLYD